MSNSRMARRTADVSTNTYSRLRRLAILSLPLYLLMLPAAGHAIAHPLPFLIVFFLLCALYLQGVRLANGAGPGTLPWIVGAGLLFRCLLLPANPSLSGDPYRYVWDARVAAHGFNPYTAIPDSPPLQPLHDGVLYPVMGYHYVPTLYPPGAQALFSLAYHLAPDQVVAVKLLLFLFDLAAAALLLLLLYHYNRPASLVLVYLWNPLVIVEFAHSGHVDAAATACVLAALLATHTGRSWSAGIWLGLATLLKIYPILLLPALVQRRQFRPVLACLLTVALGYGLAALVYGRQLFGYLGKYLGQDHINGSIYPVVNWIGSHLGLGETISQRLPLALLAGVLVWATHQRWLGRGDTVGMMLLITTAYLLVAPTVLPWYVTACVPLVALTVGRPALPARLAGLPAALLIFSAGVALEYTHHAYGDGNWPAVLLEYAILYGLLALSVSGIVPPGENAMMGP